jgi:mannose/cellobiose epimerase-like protein (N-acyl-D-glucosamine 2-epimerase family)
VQARRFNSNLLAIILIASTLWSYSVYAAAAAQRNGITRANVVDAARAGGDYLIRMQKADGSFHYYYDPAQDLIESRTYNIVRHSGTIISLFDLYESTRDPRYLQCARRAIGFLKSRFREARHGKAEYVLDFDGKAKLGAIGLSLAALADQIRLDNRFADPNRATRLANMILAMQRKTGSFEMRYRLPDADEQGIESLYYPGEALLGLIRLFKLNGDRKLFDAARRGIAF